MSYQELAEADAIYARRIMELEAVNAELLAALKCCVRDLEMWPGEKNPEFFASVKSARAAIAKAKGKEQPK